MRIGLITESKNDYEAVKLIINKILPDAGLEFEGAFGMGCGDIISQKKVFSNKLKNQKCDYVIIIRDSDGGEAESLKARLVQEYSRTDIRHIFTVSIAIEEIEAWFLGDVQCLKEMYELNKSARIPIAGKTDDFHSPKEVLKRFIDKSSKGIDTYIESDAARLAELLNINTVSDNSSSFRDFRQTIERLVTAN